MTLVKQRTKVVVVAVKKLKVSEANVRKHGIDKNRLKSSIKKNGVLEPLHVWHNSETGSCEILQGQHRYYGALAAGLKEIECVLHLDVKTLEDAKKWCRKQTCLQEDLDTSDKLQIALDLKEKYGSLKKGCEEEGLSYAKLSDWYTLRKLSKEVREAISTEKSDRPKLPLRKLKEIARFPEEKQIGIAKKIAPLRKDSEIRKVLRQEKGQVERPKDEVSGAVKVKTLAVYQVVDSKDEVLASKLLPAYVEDLKRLRKINQ